MSLTRTLLRALTVIALRGDDPEAPPTLAGAHVYDSRNDPLDTMAANAPQPVIAVYTDEDSTSAAERSLALVIEWAVNVREDSDSGGDPTLWVPQTDDGLEMTLDLIEQQIHDALEADASPAAALWRRMVTHQAEVTSRRAALDPTSQVRLAARQLVWRLRLLRDPVAGQASPLLDKALDLLAADPHYAPAVEMLRGFAGRKSGRAMAAQQAARLLLDQTSTRHLRFDTRAGARLEDIALNDPGD